jgi:hypothetical protein
MFKQYEVTAELWIKGIKKSVGDVVSMVEAETKYLKHALKEVEGTVSQVVSSAVQAAKPQSPATPVPATPAPGVAVAEAPRNDSASN